MSPLPSALYMRPVEGDCDPYYFSYINLVPDDVDVLTLLHTQRDWFGDFIELLSPEKALFSYAPGKWTLSEMIGHVLDTERVFAYRMMAISRNDKNSFPGFDQDVYVRESNYRDVEAPELAAEWRAIRSATIYLARHMNATMASHVGIANNIPIRASVYPYLMAGHVKHHYQIAQDRYMLNH